MLMTMRAVLIIISCLVLTACNTTGGGGIGDKAQTQLDRNYPRGL